MWVLLAFCSAACLGFYDVFKKISLKDNAVLPVLALNTLFSALFFLPFIILSYVQPTVWQDTLFFVSPVSPGVHGFILLKSCIVLSSWVFGYYGMKHLPLTIVGPVNATRPVLTLLGALFIFGERLNPYQWTGVLLGLLSIFLLSKAGKKEGIDFRRDRWMICLFLAALLGAASGLYDKYLMQHFPPMTVQAWYTQYQCLLMGGVLFFLWYPKRHMGAPFRWRYAILLISLFLCLADFVYFYALSMDGALISVVSMIRRGSVVVSFSVGALFLHEKHIRHKLLDLLLIIIGMLFLYWGSR